MRSEWTSRGRRPGRGGECFLPGGMAVSASMGSSVRRRSSIALGHADRRWPAGRAIGAGAVVEVGLPQGGDELRHVASQELGFAEAAFDWRFAVDPPVHCPRHG